MRYRVSALITGVVLAGAPNALAQAPDAPAAAAGAAVAAGPYNGADEVEPATTDPETEAPAAESGPAAPAASPAPEPVAHDVQVRELEERVNQLKMRIYQSKARLVRLQEAVLHGVVSGARARLVHRNEMGSTFVLTEAHYFLDGAPLKQMVDTKGSLSRQAEIELFAGQIVPGNHQLSVNLVYSGSGYGLFSYLRGYRFKIRSSYTFTAEEGKLTEIKAVGFEKGGITTDLKDRPTVRYDVEVSKDTERVRKKLQETGGNVPVATGN